MTWGEFKTAVEAQEVRDRDVIDLIDVSGTSNNITVKETQSFGQDDDVIRAFAIT